MVIIRKKTCWLYPSHMVPEQALWKCDDWTWQGRVTYEVLQRYQLTELHKCTFYTYCMHDTQWVANIVKIMHNGCIMV